MGLYTKSQVQAGYFYDTNEKLVLIVVYSTDKEGKSGAIVSRVSGDYGETWTASLNITGNQHKFGLAVAPDSTYVARTNNGKVALFKYSDAGWVTLPKKDDQKLPNQSKGLAVISGQSSGGGFVSISCVGNDEVLVANYDLSTETWGSSFALLDGWMTNDTAWEKQQGTDFYILAAKNTSNWLGAFFTDDPTNEASYFPFFYFVKAGQSPISGIWQDTSETTGTAYILSTPKQVIKGTVSSGKRTTLYTSNQNSSIARRVSMFNVPQFGPHP